MSNLMWIIIYVPCLLTQDYLMQLSRDLQVSIYQWVVYDNDFNKAFSNFKNLKRINKKFKALGEEPLIKSSLLSSAFHGDLNTNLANISYLASHNSLNCIDGNDEHSQTLIKQNLMPQVAHLFSYFPQRDLRDPKSSLFVTPDDTTKLFAFISSSIIGTTTIINTLAEQLKSDSKPVKNFIHLIYYTGEKKWHANVQVYLRVFESIKRMSQNEKNATVLSLCQFLLGKAVESRDRLNIHSLLKNNTELDINITHPLYLCIQNSREDWKNKSETIQLMLSLSTNLEAPRIISELYKLKGDYHRISEDERQDIEKMMNVIIDINYEKRHGIKRKLI